tara:strand:+ start:551 stop:1015 length:465 start_codon:yes stop_codon:yes gene_type:complete
MATPACVKKYAKSSGKSVSTLNKVYKRGQGAYFSSGSRPGQSSHSWGCGRVRSFATGKGGARKADADLLGKGKKKKRTKKVDGGDVNMNKVSQKRKTKNLKPVPEGKKGKGLSMLPTTVRNNMGFMKDGGRVTSAIGRGCGAVMENKRKVTKFF